MTTFTQFLGISVFPRLSIIVWVGPFKKSWPVPRPIFAFLMKNDLKHVSHLQNRKFLVWRSIDLVTLDNLGFKYVYWKLRMVSVEDTIHGGLLTYPLLPFDMVVVRDSIRHDKSSWLLSDLWRHRWPRNQQHYGYFHKYSRPIERYVNFVKWSSCYWDLRGEGDKKKCSHFCHTK